MFRGLFGLSQKAYITCVVKRFNQDKCLLGDALIVKRDKVSKSRGPLNDLKREAMKRIPYASVVGSLMYAQVCTHTDITNVVSTLGRFQSKSGWISEELQRNLEIS